jgi:hypothetical protein
MSGHLYMMVGMEKHSLEHEHHAQHSAKQASSICTWMCGSSASVHLVNPSFSQNPSPTLNHPATYTEPIFNNLSIFYFRDRSPPVFLS